jgi:hypothetical protein
LLDGNDLQSQKSGKIAKTQKQTRFLFRETSILLPKRPKKGLFFLSVLDKPAPLAFLVIAAEEIALISGITVFEPSIRRFELQVPGGTYCSC